MVNDLPPTTEVRRRLPDAERKKHGDEPTSDPGFTHDVFVDRSGIALGDRPRRDVRLRRPPTRCWHTHLNRSDENVPNSGKTGPKGRRGQRLPARLPASQLDPHRPPEPRSPKAAPARRTRKASRPPPPAPATSWRSPRRTTRVRPARAGSLQTWQITGEHNTDGRQAEMLDQWTTELNELLGLRGRSPATVNCSAHWFDEDSGLVAQGWYDQGVRFMDISTRATSGRSATTSRPARSGRPTSPRPTRSARSSTASTRRAASTCCGSTARRRL